MYRFAITLALGGLGAAMPNPTSDVASAAPIADVPIRGNEPGGVYACAGSYWQPPCHWLPASYAPENPKCYAGFQEANGMFGSIQPDPYTLCLGFSMASCSGSIVWKGMWESVLSKPPTEPTEEFVSLLCVAHFGGINDTFLYPGHAHPSPIGVCNGVEDNSCYEQTVTETQTSTAATTIETPARSLPPYPSGNSSLAVTSLDTVYGTAVSSGTPLGPIASTGSSSASITVPQLSFTDGVYSTAAPTSES